MEYTIVQGTYYVLGILLDKLNKLWILAQWAYSLMRATKMYTENFFII